VNNRFFDLSGYTQEKSGLWRDLCSTLYPKLENPYLRAIFAFLTASADEKDEVLAHTGMKLCDQIAFACIFISDSKLHDYIGKAWPFIPYWVGLCQNDTKVGILLRAS
jgi:hypothetical protein